MKRITVIGILCICFLPLMAESRLNIPLDMRFILLAPPDGPTGSTPDPTDPNQFCATLVGNKLVVQTQSDAISYVVVRSDFSEQAGEDYFYSLSTDSVSCEITRPGTYSIQIGHWNVDFVGWVKVKSINWYDFTGRNYGHELPSDVLSGYYFLCIETNLGKSTTKYFIIK